MKPVAITPQNFDSEVLKATLPVLVDFWAPWCGPCLMVAPIVEELAQEYDGKASFVKLNVDEHPLIAGKYGVRSIPTLIIFKGGKPFSQVIGFRPKKELKKFLDQAIV